MSLPQLLSSPSPQQHTTPHEHQIAPPSVNNQKNSDQKVVPKTPPRDHWESPLICESP